MTGLLHGFTVAILIAHGFEQVEMTEPKKALEDAGAKVVIVSPEQKTVKGWKSDLNQWADEFIVDVALDDAHAENYDALLLPGGLMSPDDLRLNEKAVEFVQGFANKPIAAICHGPWTLIDADLVAGKNITSWPSIKRDLINAGAIWVDHVVTDKNLVTARMPDDIPLFNEAMINLFAEINSLNATLIEFCKKQPNIIIC